MDSIAFQYIPLLGLAVGSFLGLVIDRVPRGQSIVSPPSSCDHCHRRLTPLDLIPLLSYVVLRGRCRFCGARIPMRSFLVEAATATFFALVILRFGQTSEAWVIVAFGCLFIAISVIDIEWTIIPDKLVLVGVIAAFTVAPFGPAAEGRTLGEAFISIAVGGALGFGLMLLIYIAALVLYKSSVGFGFGDVKLGGLIGLVIGFPEVLIPVRCLYFRRGGGHIPPASKTPGAQRRHALRALPGCRRCPSPGSGQGFRLVPGPTRLMA